MNRGADRLARTLKARAGVDWIAAMSGNQVMPVFDAAIDAGIELVHVRHEAAAVHMADAWGRLTNRPGVALVPAGPGFANALSALYVARMAESPLVMLSGHAPGEQAGRGAFQEMPQAEMAAHVSKASWTVTNIEQLSADVARALLLSRSGRTGPVHLSVPVDVLEATATEETAVDSEVNAGETTADAISVDVTHRVLDSLAGAQRPLVLVGPAMRRAAAGRLLDEFSLATGIPVITMESPRGVNDPSLGAVAEVLTEADAVLLLGKKLDFTLRTGGDPEFHPGCRLLQIDPEQEAINLSQRVIAAPSRVPVSAVADPVSSLTALTAAARQRKWPSSGWLDEVKSAIAYRPAAWNEIDSGTDGPLHPVEVCRGIREFLSGEDDVFISDGGEFGQWAQACVAAPHRVINGPSGAIGGSIPFALAARKAFPRSRIVAALGDGTFGFHAMEFDTAVRHALPFVAVVGNDAAWNAEYQIQLRKYGPERAIGCRLLPTRYDRIVAAAGGYGESVGTAGAVLPALQRAESSGLPACVNTMISQTAAPVIRRNA